MEKKLTAQEMVSALGLEPLPQEGGMFRRTWEHCEETTARCTASAIYYLLADQQFSHLHRLTCDEVYSYVAGDPLELLMIRPDGTAQRYILGPDAANGQQPQIAVDRDTWQGSRLYGGGRWGLVSTVCCPGFTEDSYEHCLHHTPLVQAHPALGELICALCPEA